MRQVFAAAAVILTLAAPAAQAITTFGNVDCGAWTKSPSLWHRAWLVGYLSGLNKIVADDKKGLDPLGKLQSPDQAYLWMDNYCKANPLNSLATGATQLYFELINK